jgi:Glycosyl hydrolases family 39
MNKKSNVIALFVLLSVASVAKAQTPETVTVVYSANNGPATYRASGFLHGMNSTSPITGDITPLKPQTLRSDYTVWGADTGTYARAVSLGITNHINILGDWWIGNYGGYNPSGARIVTSSNMANWNSMVALAVNTAISNGQTFQWEPWNEPDLTEFWTGTEAQYQAMWQNAVNTIRGISGSQTIVGPSTSCGYCSWATDLLAFAKTNNVLPTIVNWHEANGNNIASDTASFVSYLGTNEPSLANSLSINEYVSNSDNYLPGANIHYVAAIERAGPAILESGHTCWSTADCGQGGSSPSLDGFTNNGRIANWYAYQAYANITGNIVGVTPSADVDGVAGSDSASGQAFSVFGIDNTTATVNFVFTNIPSYLVGGGNVHVTAYLLANDSGAGSTGPTQTIDTDYAVSSSSITVTYANLAPYQVAIIQLTTGGGASSQTPLPPKALKAVVH